MKTYFHISNSHCQWKIGDEIHIELEDNYYWKSFIDNAEFIELQGEKHDVYKITRTALEAYTGMHPAPLKMNGYHFKSLYTLKEAIDSLGNTIKLNRELVFESIRKEFYPKLPSRQKCLWLIPSNEKSLEFWKNTINNRHQRIFKVAVDGNVHRAAHEWLIGGTFSINEWNKLAHNYWKGIGSGNTDDEILFDGKIRIIEEVKFT